MTAERTRNGLAGRSVTMPAQTEPVLRLLKIPNT